MDHPQLPRGARHRVNPAGACISRTWYGSVGQSWSRWEYHRVALSLQIKCLEPGLCHMSVGHSWSRWEYHRVASSLQIKCFEPHVGGSAPHGLMLSHIFQAWLTIATRRQNFRMYLGVGLAQGRKSLDPSHSHAAPGLALNPPGRASLALRYHCNAPLSLDIISVGQP